MTDTAAAPTPPAPRRRRWPRVLAMAVLVLVLLAGSALGWLLGTASGLQFAVARVQAATHGALSVGRAEGRLIGPLTLHHLRYRDGQGTDIQVSSAQLDIAFWPLWRKRLHVRDLQADGITVALPPGTPNPPASRGTFNLQPPLDLVLDRVRIGALAVQRGGHPVFSSRQLTLAGAWTSHGITIRQLALDAADGHAALDGVLALGKRDRGDGRASFDWSAAGHRYAGTLKAHSDGRLAQLDLALTRPATAVLHLQLTQGGRYAWTGALEVPRFDPRPVLGPGALIALATSLRGSGDRRSGTLTGQLELDDFRLQLQPLRASFSEDLKTLHLQQLSLRSPQTAGTLEASGKVQLDASPIQADLALRWKDVALPAALVGQPLRTSGNLTAAGSSERFRGTAAAAIGPPGKPARLALDIDGTPRQIALNSLALTRGDGSLEASGTLSLKPALGWRLQLQATRFDPGELFAGWDGALDTDLTSHGQLTAAGIDATLALRSLGGQLRQHALHGSGTLHLSPARVVDGALKLTSGSSTIRVTARPGSRNDADLALAITSLGDWLPGTSGRLDGHFKVLGVLPKLSVNGTLHGQALVWAQQRAAALRLIVGIPDLSRPSGKLELDARGVDAAGLAFAQIRLLAEGSQTRHRLTLSARGTQLSGDLALDGAMRGTAWRGTLSRLDLAPQGLPRWQLQKRSQLNYDRGALGMTALCLSAGKPQLCASASRDKAGNLDASYTLRALPLALLVNAAGYADLPLRVDGELAGNGELRRSANGILSGHASLVSSRGSINYTDHADQPLLDYRDLGVQARLAPGSQQVTAHASLDQGGRFDGHLGISGAAKVLDGQLDLHVNNLAFVELLTDEVANVKGALNGHFRFGGTMDAPAVTGAATLDHFAAEVPAAGLKLSQGQLTLSTRDAHTFRIDGRVHSGDGSLAVAGTAGLGTHAATEITLTGSRFTAADIPSARVVVSPDLTLRQGPQGLDVGGKVSLDSADVDLAKLPGAGATRASPDVVVMDEKPSRPKAGPLPITANIAVELGGKTHVVGMGLDGTLGGQLTVRQRAGRAATGQGQIAVSGSYKAYGQKLTIEHGQLLFAGTPLDNPGLNIRAVRKLNPNATIDDGQKVGLYVSGTAQRPVLTVFSQPVLEQSDALSYLLTGKPLSDLKGGEGSMVTSAARALGSAGGGLLAKRIGSQLGVDEIGVSSNDALGGSSAFTVGKYLSPRLYLSYGVGLFEPGQVITLRYRLSKRWNFEAQNATNFNRASFNYRYEK